MPRHSPISLEYQNCSQFEGPAHAAHPFPFSMAKHYDQVVNTLFGSYCRRARLDSLLWQSQIGKQNRS